MKNIDYSNIASSELVKIYWQVGMELLKRYWIHLIVIIAIVFIFVIVIATIADWQDKKWRQKNKEARLSKIK